MLALILRRLLQSVAVLAVVAFIAFALVDFTDDPVAFMVGQDETVHDRARLAAALGPDPPFYRQSARFAELAARRELGISLREGRPPAQLLRERVPATLERSTAAALLAAPLGIPAGVYAALALLLPAFTLALLPMTLAMRLVRSEMPRTDCRFARARGFADRPTHGHALKNMLVPVITCAGVRRDQPGSRSSLLCRRPAPAHRRVHGARFVGAR